MTGTITGIGSGFDIDGWVSSLVSAKQESTVTPLRSKLSTLNSKNSALTSLKSKCSTLLSSLQTFTKTLYNTSSDIWTNTSITSSNSAYATATSKGNVAASSVELKIDQIATSTTATSAANLGALDEESVEDIKFTNLANGQAKAGDFSLFLNGKEFKITINQDDTMKDVMDNIAKETNNKVQLKVEEGGYLSISAFKQDENEEWVVDTESRLSLGTSSDTSNFVSALKLNEQTGDYAYTSSHPVSSVLTNVAMTDEESGIKGIKFFKTESEEGEAEEETEEAEVTSGTITINGADFKVDKSTTLNDLISRINGNSDAHVHASFDSLTNKLILTSSETGRNNISFSESGTNLLEVFGFTKKVDGEEVINEDAQKLGENAIVYINGNKVVSHSNTITGESSGIANLSITVKKPTASEEETLKEGEETSVKLSIEPDYSNIESSLQTFVNAYNDVISTIKTATTSDGVIGSDASLRSLASSLKNILSSTGENDGMYNLLSQIGISTSNSDITKISIDSSKLKNALSENLYSVKQLLSDGYTSKTDNGIFDKMANVLTSVMDSQKGYFATSSESINNQITSLNKRIETANDRLSKYQIQMTNKFNKMDSVMASLSAQLSTFQSYM